MPPGSARLRLPPHTAQETPASSGGGLEWGTPAPSGGGLEWGLSRPATTRQRLAGGTPGRVRHAYDP